MGRRKQVEPEKRTRDISGWWGETEEVSVRVIQQVLTRRWQKGRRDGAWSAEGASQLCVCAPARECVLLNVVLTKLTIFKNPKFGFCHIFHLEVESCFFLFFFFDGKTLSFALRVPLRCQLLCFHKSNSDTSDL